MRAARPPGARARLRDRRRRPGGRRGQRRRSSSARRPSASSPSCGASSRRRIRTPASRCSMEVGAAAVVLPELVALRGVEQNVFHHLDVYGHTLEVLREAAALHEDPRAALGAELAEPVAAPPRRAAGRRADPRRRRCGWRRCCTTSPSRATRGVRPDGRVTFVGHDRAGADMARAALRRLRASERLRRLRRGAHPPPPAAGLPRARAAAVAPRRVALPDRDGALRGRRDAADGRRPPRDPRAQRRRGDRRAPRARAPRCSREALRAAGGARRAARARRRPGAGRSGIAPGPQLGALLAQLEEDRFAGELAHPRGRDQAGAGAALGAALSRRQRRRRTPRRRAPRCRSPRVRACRGASGSWRPSCTRRRRRCTPCS